MSWRPLRIAFLYDAVFPDISGGVERRIWEISRRLARRGHDVHIFGMHVWIGNKTIIREGITFHGICRPLHLYGKKGKRRIFPALVFGAASFFALAREHFDIVDCQQFPYTSALSCLLSSRLSGSPVLITWHEVWGDYWYEYLGYQGAAGKFLERLLAMHSVYNIAVSETVRDNLRVLIPARTIKVIPNGVDLAAIDSVIPASGSTDVVFTGRLIHEKHVDVLIEAVEILRKQNIEIRCLIIGDGPERKMLEGMVDERNLRDSISFTGFLPRFEDVVRYMKSSRVFVFPSTREGFGMAALEALACGLPVVTVDHPKNAARFLVTGDCGALSSLDPGVLSTTIRNVLEDPGKGGDKSRRRAQEYDWEPIVDAIEEYYAQVVRKYPAGAFRRM